MRLPKVGFGFDPFRVRCPNMEMEKKKGPRI